LKQEDQILFLVLNPIITKIIYFPNFGFSTIWSTRYKISN